MEEIKENKLATKPIKKLVWEIGLPMIVSMILQALRYAFKPFLTAILRLVVFCFPNCISIYTFTRSC